MRSQAIICECFARDGLQHEDAFVPTADKIVAIDAFTAAGFKRIEATSYSHPKHVPAFSDASEVLAGIKHASAVYYKATCPNLRAVERALTDLKAGHGANELSLLVSATQSHTERNLRTSREGQWERVAEMARAAQGRFRLVGVVSVAFGCPFEGSVDPGVVVEDAARFAELGASHVTIGDTTGHANPAAVKTLMSRLVRDVPQIVPVGHFHDSRGTGLVNCLAAIDAGITHLDSAMGGVGGHPSQIDYGEGYTGNVATEDLVNLLEESGIDTGLNLDRLWRASELCEKTLGRPLHSKVARAGFGLKTREHVQ